MISPYYPPTNDGRADWWQNIVNVGAAPLTALGFGAPQVTSITNDAIAGAYLYRTLPTSFDEFGKRVTGYIHTYLSDPDGTPAPLAPAIPTWPVLAVPVLAGIDPRREKWVQQAKHAGNYDPLVQGAVLRIEPTGTPFDPTTYQAEIFGAMSPGPATMLVKFRKARGQIDAVAIAGRRTGTTAWVPLGTFTATPATFLVALQTPGVPETWDLQAQALIKDAKIGVPSDIVTAIVRA